MRSGETRRDLITGLAGTWSGVTGELVEGFVLFVVETLGASTMEEGEILREAFED